MEPKKAKWYQKIFIALIIVLLSPILILGFALYFAIYIAPSPIEIIWYRHTFYYRELKVKYSFGMWWKEEVAVFNLIRRHNLKLNYFYNSFNKFTYIEAEPCNVVFCWFEEVIFDPSEQKWLVSILEHNELVGVTDCLNEFIANNICDSCKPIRILIHESIFTNENRRHAREDIRLAKANPLFLIYRGRKDLLRSLSLIQLK